MKCKKYKNFILGFIVLLLLLLYIYNKYNKYNKYNNLEQFKNSIVVNCPNKNTIASKLFPNDTYFKYFNDVDKTTRNLNNKSLKQIRKHYIENILDFTEDEKSILNKVINSIIQNLSKENTKLFLLKDWNFIKFSKIENNFPHTHENFIFIPQRMISNNLNSSYNKETLVHEKVHIFQRTNPNLFEDLFINYWNFIKTPIQNLEIIQNKMRTNPDGLDNNWVFSKNNKYILIGSVYNKNPVNIGDTTNYGIFLEKINNKYKIINPIKKIPLNDIPEFIDFFGKINSNYHPNELSAEIIPEHILGNPNNTLSYLNFKKWWNKIE